jgi:uncharacterized protein (TIGR04255 family)
MTTVTGEFFPAVPRVLYRKPPLLQVVCQARFPAILRIESAPPAEFQDRVRKTFPLLERPKNILMPQLPAQLLQILGPQIGASGWHFLTESRSAAVMLSQDSISLTSTSYHHWEEFKEPLLLAIGALWDIYAPSFFTQIGLRYQDMIQRNAIGLAGVSWAKLLGADLIGELAHPGIEQNLQDARRMVRIQSPVSGNFMLLQHGLAKTTGSDEVGYLIDLDFSAIRHLELGNVESTLDDLHRDVGRAFRWCISDRLHDALEPTPLGDGAIG